jgi:thiamine-phosphate pyrophosphorylase
MAYRFELPKIYPITDRSISGLSHQEQVSLLKQGGATVIQLRDKTAPSREFYDAVNECLEANQNVRLIVNDRVDIALVAKAHGVHLGQDDLPPQHARKLLGDSAIIGYSTHTVEQAKAAIELPIDYVAFGPIFPTGTKADHDPVVGIDMLKGIRDIVGGFPLVAIGGINLSNLASVFDAGADSAAIISALVADPETITENMQNALKIADISLMINTV